MKKIIAVLSVFMLTTFAIFAQSSEMTQLAVVKLNKNEFITLKQLKTRCTAYEKSLGRALTVDERKQVLDTVIEEKLIVQAYGCWREWCGKNDHHWQVGGKIQGCR